MQTTEILVRLQCIRIQSRVGIPELRGERTCATSGIKVRTEACKWGGWRGGPRGATAAHHTIDSVASIDTATPMPSTDSAEMPATVGPQMTGQIFVDFQPLTPDPHSAGSLCQNFCDFCGEDCSLRESFHCCTAVSTAIVLTQGAAGSSVGSSGPRFAAGLQARPRPNRRLG
jgi:hypothetical protein